MVVVVVGAGAGGGAAVLGAGLALGVVGPGACDTAAEEVSTGPPTPAGGPASAAPRVGAAAPSAPTYSYSSW